MFADLQAAYVSRLRERLAAALQEGEPTTRPLAARPYAGELLDAPRLLNAVPVVLVDLAGGDVEAEDENAAATTAGFALDFICAARNLYGQDDAASEAAGLLSWVLWAIRGEPVELPDGSLVQWTKVHVRPVLRSRDLCAFALQPVFEIA